MGASWGSSHLYRKPHVRLVPHCHFGPQVKYYTRVIFIKNYFISNQAEILQIYYRVTSLLLLKELRLAENPIPYKKNSSVVHITETATLCDVIKTCHRASEVCAFFSTLPYSIRLNEVRLSSHTYM